MGKKELPADPRFKGATPEKLAKALRGPKPLRPTRFPVNPIVKD